jgi:dihydroxyacid dehydratase/phosphogluconate dehydratase
MSEKQPPNKMKPRSGLVTDGLERAPARGMLRAVGFKDEDLQQLFTDIRAIKGVRNFKLKG